MPGPPTPNQAGPYRHRTTLGERLECQRLRHREARLAALVALLGERVARHEAAGAATPARLRADVVAFSVHLAAVRRRIHGLGASEPGSAEGR